MFTVEYIVYKQTGNISIGDINKSADMNILKFLNLIRCKYYIEQTMAHVAVAKINHAT